MRDRHFPRVCGSCRAPMARQENMCWRCGTRWASGDEPRTRLTLIAGGAAAPRADPAPAVIAETERWANEGGSVI